MPHIVAPTHALEEGAVPMPVPAPAPTPVAVPPSVDLHALMLAVVAEKTGYPAEMLNLDLDLEGDLGIDSIKRVEILAAIQEQAADMPAVDTAAIGSLKTLGSIVDHIQGLLKGAAAPVATPTAPVETPL